MCDVEEDIDEELLIITVEKYPELYDLQHPQYDNQQRRNNIWDEIGTTLNKTASECRDKWKRIRENYKRAKKLRKTKSGQASKKMKSPKHDKILSFLLPYIEYEGETISNLQDTITIDDSNDVSLASSSSSAKSANRPYKIVKRKKDDSISPTQKLFEDYLEKKYQQKKENTGLLTSLLILEKL